MMPALMPSPPKEPLQIYLLGTPLVKWEGQILPIPRRNVRGLLYHLAAQGQLVPRDRLCLLFWPDHPEASARRNLTRLLTHLRMALPDPTILIAEENLVNVDKEKIWCDIAEFNRLSTQKPSVAETLEEAVRLYRQPFLSGFDLPDCLEFDQWIAQERAVLERIYLEDLTQLINSFAASRDYSKAISYAQQYLASDELAEEVHRRLILLYALEGNRAMALRQFEACVSVLEEQLGTDPLPETRAIYQAVLENRLPTLPAERVEDIKPALAHSLRLDVPLVGRSLIIRILEDTFQKASKGQSCVVLLSGEPGIGKSRLLHHFMTSCWGKGLVLYGAGQRGEQSVSYHPIVEALRQHVTLVPLSLPPYWLAEVARLLPELSSLYPHLPAPLALKGQEARIRLFEALSQCFTVLHAVAGPVLLCLDDLHWFDRTSLSWLVYLSRQLLSKNSQMMVLGTYRSEDSDKIQDLREDLARPGLLKEISLGGLSPADILELLRHLYGALPGSENFAERLRDATGGNPFFLLETLRSFAEEEKISGDLNRLVDFPLPDSVLQAVDRRLGRLKPHSRQVLEAGAVLGSTFEMQAARLTAGRNEVETNAGLMDLIKRQLLLEQAGGYRFSHDLVYRATLASIGPMRRQLLHSRAARALERLRPQAVTALAYHYEAGGELDKALAYYRRSARNAEALFAWQEAVSLYARMYQVVERIDPDCIQADCLEQRSEALKAQARLNHLQGFLPERDANLEQMDCLVSSSHNQDLELQALLLRIQYLNLDGRYSEAVSSIEKGLTLASRLDKTLNRCQLLIQLGFSDYFLGQPLLALPVLEDAKRIADDIGDVEVRGQVMSRMAFIQGLFGNYHQALEYQLGSYACYQKLKDHYGAARCLIEIGNFYASLGNFDRAWQALQEILTLTRKAGVRSDEAHALLALGGYYACKGEYVPALEALEQALTGLRATRAQNMIASAETSMGMVFYHLGNLAQARAWLERGLQSARAIGHRMRTAQALVQLGLLEITEQELALAREHLGEGTKLAKESHDGEDLTAGLVALARLERSAVNFDQALRFAKEALAEAQRLELVALEVWARTEAGLALLASGDAAQAQEMIQPALLLAGAAPQHWSGTEEVYLANARILQHLGQSAVAEEQLRQANEIIQSKAAAISDPAMRQAFLSRFDFTLINIL